MFDFTPLSASHFIFLLVTFSAVFTFTGRVRGKYAGVVLATVATLASALALPDFSLAVGVTLAALVIAVVGRADERHPLSAQAQLFWQLAAAAILVLFGWTIPYVSNPFGEGVIQLGALSLPLTVGWIILMMNAVNWLDGLDGLASAVSIVAFLTLAAVSLLPATQDATTLGLALIGAGSLLGFFLHNAPPARVYLGTTGSWFVGMFLALTALIGGGKVATATLVLAIPLLDAALVIVQRLLNRQKPWVGDKKHLHYRLAALGWSPRQIMVAATALSLALGVVAVTAQTQEKIWALGLVALFLAATILTLSYKHYAQPKDSHH